MLPETPHPYARFRLRTLFLATATCAAAFAVMVRWHSDVVVPLAALVPAAWLVAALVSFAHALEHARTWAAWPVQSVLLALALMLILIGTCILIGAATLAVVWMVWG